MCESCNPSSRMLSRRQLIRASALGVSTLAIGVAGARTILPALAQTDGTPEATPAAVHWTYEGEDGPQNWGKLESDYSACSVGTEQSPINIVNPTHVDLKDIAVSYQPIDPMRIINNGHTIQINVDPGSTIVLQDTTYELTQFHFHAPSEHRVDGAASAMELHMVHKSSDGKLAVIGILLKEGATNDALAPVFDNMATTAGPEQSIAVTVHPDQFFPADHATYRYKGSLTTPPCTEGIAWSVFTQQVEIGTDQLAAFHASFGENARPVQPLDGREVDED